MLKINGLAYCYRDSETQITFPNWSVEAGDHSMILGGSGSGKTTLLHLIGGLLKPKSGELWVGSENLPVLKPTELDRFRGLHIGIIFQRPHLISSLTILDNLTLSQYLGKKKLDKKKTLEIMDRLDISTLKNRKVHQVSQGQAQRVSIARALLNNPLLLLADEPTASLDDTNCERVIHLLKEQAAIGGATLVVATHDQRVKDEFENRLEL